MMGRAKRWRRSPRCSGGRPMALSDPSQRLARDRRIARDMDVVELAPHMRPACVRVSPGKEEDNV
jgi:hypothetical protein